MTKFLNRKIALLLAFVMFISVFPITESFAAHELISNNTFNEGVGLPWHIVVNDPAKASFDISGGIQHYSTKSRG
ncbi:hypothetical protein EHE19_001770 [Ruminiclostridium herbifermentans]|uniref:Uncharacterized protein n=1 Tax=Ruminiclostridium herbifermentans TaxID=2488810 RepID=A0A4U7J964_9FIRM|nr:hypothetical protein [Ruminiclostridium herbifermentans]QNU67296.1 hypothetical protein EHE19_001770 [Ruminiclostridium herbifermentans]